mmetsp:Transcript_18928/g.39877  ORF Transcript_18928/g.39877 Transcript_18928/m.39877 type:complete len:238 (+) Transcript_18928:987-1700(+)
MLVTDQIGQLLPESLNLSMVASITLLHINHRRAQQRTLSHMISHIGEHRFQQRYTLSIACASHGNSHGHTACISNMGVETLQQKANQLRDTLRGLVQHQRQPNHRGHSNIIAHITNCRMKQNANGLIGSRAAIRQRQAIHGPVPNDGVAVSTHLLDRSISILLLTIIHKRQADGNAPNNLLMLRFARVVAQFRHNLRQLLVRGGSIGISRAASNEDHTHGDARRLSGHGRIRIQQFL